MSLFPTGFERPSIHQSLLYSLVLVLGALDVCVVLLNGVEDHTADTAGVTTAQPWRDRDKHNHTQVQQSL